MYLINNVLIDLEGCSVLGISNRLETETSNREVKNYMELCDKKVRTNAISAQIPIADKNKFV